MSKKRQMANQTPRRVESNIWVRSFAVRHQSAHLIAPHTHDWHQLIYASEGVLWVRTAQGDWVVPPNRAVWVPARVEHAIEITGRVLVQTLYLSTEIGARFPARCCAVNVSPLLRELIIHIVKIGVLDQVILAHARLTGVLLDLIEALPTIPLRLPSPIDRRAKKVADWLRGHPNDPGLIKPMAKRAATSARTLERLFQNETGMTFGRWRQQLRLLHAMRLLAEGRAVTSVALDIGYDSPSAFIAMFRRALGTTPRRYFALEHSLGATP
jgi:AraC-like DNA-binding protein